MSFGLKQGSAIGTEQAAKAYAAECNVGCAPMRPPSQDPASMREQLSALSSLCERINSQRNRLREIADYVLGPETESPSNSAAGQVVPVGGVVADMLSVFESAGSLLRDVDRQIERISRVAS